MTITILNNYKRKCQSKWICTHIEFEFRDFILNKLDNLLAALFQHLEALTVNDNVTNDLSYFALLKLLSRQYFFNFALWCYSYNL